jgi:DNA-binding Lrp family transcriptional regulator
VIAYVVVKCEPGMDNSVAKEIVKIDGVMEADWTYGFCDILFKINVQSVKKLNEIMFTKVRKIPGVESTETIIVSPIPIYGRRPSRASKSR